MNCQEPFLGRFQSKWKCLNFGNYNSDDVSIVDFGINLNHSYDREVDRAELRHNMNMDFFTMLGVTP